MKLFSKNSHKVISSTAQLVKLCAAKEINLRPGTRAETDTRKTIYLPWLDENADEKQKLRFFCFAAHENSHFYGESDCSSMAKEKVKHFCQNAADDIRCERLQEKEYKGLVEYRRPFKRDLMEEFLNKEIAEATKKEKGTFIHALGCLMIQRIRMPELGMQRELGEMKVSPELQEAYDKHFLDLENQARRQTSFQDSLDLGGVMYDRIRDLLKEEEEKKDPPQQKDPSGGDSGDEQDQEDEDPSGGNSGDEQDDDQDQEDDNEDGSNESSSGGDSSSEEQEDEGEDGESSGSSSHDGSDEGSENTGKEDQGNEIDPQEDPEEEERQARIRAKVEQELGKLDEDMDTDTEMDKIRAKINEEATGPDGPYMVDPHVQDRIIYNEKGDVSVAEEYRSQGLKILGARGSRMTKLFVSQSLPRYLTHQKSGRFDMRSFASDPLDRRNDLFKDKIGAKIDKAAVSLIIDNSGSMKGTKIVLAYQVLSALLKILSKANVPTEAIGFTGKAASNPDYRDSPVTLTIVKKFEESYGREVLRRCVPPSSMMWTPDLDALRWEVPRLWARPEKKKILLLIGDGCSEIGNTTLEYKLRRSYRKFIERCKEAGIYVFGFGIGTDLSPVLGNDCINVVTTDMGDRIVRKLTELLNRPKRSLSRAT